eukprot:8761786-Pyramimonas_sp.AAC.1
MVCKHWQQAHDGLIRALVHTDSHMMPTATASWQRFKGVTSLLDVLPWGCKADVNGFRPNISVQPRLEYQ